MPKKVFSAEKIKTTEICGLVTDLLVSGNIVASGYIEAGGYITGKSLHVDEVYTDNLYAANFEQAQDLIYAFRFGGPPVDVPSRFPAITATGLRLIVTGEANDPPSWAAPFGDISRDPETWPVISGFTGLASGTNLVFIEESGINTFDRGEHIIINPGGLYGDGHPFGLQEEHTIRETGYYWMSGCCNANVSGLTMGGNNGLLHTDVLSGGYDFERGDYIKISGSDSIYTVIDTGLTVTEGIRTLDFAPALQAHVWDSGCICLVKPTLLLEDKLENSYLPGTKVANVFPRTITTTEEGDCFLNLEGNLPSWYEDADPHWDNTILILQSTGIHGSTKFCDSSPVTGVVTGLADVHQSNIQSKFGYSIYFDGNDDAISVTDHAGAIIGEGQEPSSLSLGADPFAIEFWFFTTGHNYIDPASPEYHRPSGALLSKGSVGTDNYEAFSIFYGSGEKIHVHGLNQANSGLAAVSDNPLALNTWHHVAVVRENVIQDQMKLYINGSEEAAWAKTNSVHDVIRPLFVGKYEYYEDDPSHYFKGYIEEVRITKGVPRYEDKDIFLLGSFTVPGERSAMPFDNKYIGGGCVGSICYDSQHLYLETQTGIGRWMATGYREWFVGESGINIHITGAPRGNMTPSILTFEYPHWYQDDG
jgi:hypothetical protein